MTEVRVRIAPSPTGVLHVGTARTSLFNYLFAHHHGGKFILRIEDTDIERSEARYIRDIFDGLRLLGLNWDEGPDVGGPYAPYVQSERLNLYAEYAEKLLKNGTAYYCYCTPEELEAEKQKAIRDKRPYIYSKRCCDPEEVERLKQDPSRKAAIRFRIPDSPVTIVLDDLVRGEVFFETALIGDFVIIKSNGTPSYNFAVVVDDATMKISHVIRGEDHISNTPKQILLYQALEESLPSFAHVGMILAPDRSKLSKRHGATAVSEYIHQGYLPEAFGNFLALLGWSPPDGEEIGSLERFASKFTLSRIAPNPAIFDIEKLNWLNGHYIRSMEIRELLERAKPFMQSFDLSQYPEDKLLLMLDAVREPLTRLSELPDTLSYFFGEGISYQSEVCRELFQAAETFHVLEQFQETILPRASFALPDEIAAEIKAFSNALKPLKTKSVMWAIRAAVTGRVHGADLSKVLYILGKDRVSYRVEQALLEKSCSVRR